MKTMIFSIADKEYGVDIAQVREVVRMRQVTPVPDAAEFVEGVISLRSKVIPLISLRKKLGFEATQISQPSRIIVTQINGHRIGVIVDGVSDVIAIEQGAITPPDEVLKEARYLVGVARVTKRLILVIDIERLLTEDTKTTISDIEGRIEVRRRTTE